MDEDDCCDAIQQGPQGSAGYQGSHSDRGAQGPVGFQSGIVVIGPKGPQGLNGVILNGLYGLSGVQGQAQVGPQGDVGTQGPSMIGTQGQDGVFGLDGAQGLSLAGFQGLPGTFVVGPQGTLGLEGFQGPLSIGPQGEVPYSIFPLMPPFQQTVALNMSTSPTLIASWTFPAGRYIFLLNGAFATMEPDQITFQLVPGTGQTQALQNIDALSKRPFNLQSSVLVGSSFTLQLQGNTSFYFNVVTVDYTLQVIQL